MEMSIQYPTVDDKPLIETITLLYNCDVENVLLQNFQKLVKLI